MHLTELSLGAELEIRKEGKQHCFSEYTDQGAGQRRTQTTPYNAIRAWLEEFMCHILGLV